MTLTLPTPDTSNTARQRFALELLLQQRVPWPDQLLASRYLLEEALPDMGPKRWRALQAMPIAISAEQLDIAIPSQWRDQEWQHLIDQLPEQDRTIRQKVLPDMALNMLAIGEETEEMDKMLSKVADFYEDAVGATVKALTSMLEPAMIVVVAGIVGSILLAIYLPMFTVFDQIQ